MKKKTVILLGMLFLLCGCTAEVNLEIKDDKVLETVSINAYPDGDYTLERLPAVFRNYVPAYAKDKPGDAEADVMKKGISYYTRTQETIVNGYRFTYKYDFKLSDYKDARTVKEGFRSSNVYEDKVSKTILFSTDSGGLLYFCDEYPLLTDVRINIKTDYNVLENNADYVNDNVYTWELNKNSNNKSIYLLVDKTLDNKGNMLGNDKENNGNEEKPGNNGSSNPTGNKKDDQVKKDEKKEEYASKIEEEMNKHPFVFVVLAILLFIVIVIILSKVTKITKVR